MSREQKEKEKIDNSHRHFRIKLWNEKIKEHMRTVNNSLRTPPSLIISSRYVDYIFLVYVK